MDNIECIKLPKILNKLKNMLSAVMNRGFEYLHEHDIAIDNIKYGTDGQFTFWATTSNGDEFEVKCVPVPEKVDKFGKPTMYNLYCKSGAGKSKTYLQVSEDEFTDAMTDFVDRYMGGYGLETTWEDIRNGGDNMQNKKANSTVTASKQINATLRRVTSASIDRIDLIAVMANYDASDVLEDINTICNDKEFCSNLTSEPKSFIITQDETAFNILDADDVDISNTYEVLITSAYTTYLNLQAIHWNTFGRQFMRIHTMMDDYMDYTKGCIDRLAEIALQSADCISNPIEIIKYCTPYVPSSNFDGIKGADLAKQVIEAFVDTLDLYYPNVPHDVQSEFDNWISYFKSEALFKLRRIV